MTIQIPDEQYVEYVQLRKAQQGTTRGGAIKSIILGLFLLSLSATLLLLIADRLGFVPPAVVDGVFGTPQTTLRTQPAGVRPSLPPALPSGGGGAPAWPTLTMTPTVEPTLTPPPIPTATPLAHLVLSKPEDNPGFTCGVEPGMPANATCEETRPAPASGDDAPPPSLYSVEDRVFVPAVLPTSDVEANPGFDSGVEFGNQPTPVR